MANYKNLLRSFFQAKIVFFLGALFAISLSTWIFAGSCEALYIDNSVHSYSHSVESTKEADIEGFASKTAPGFVNKGSEKSAFSLLNLIEIIATSIVTGLGVKFIFHDKLLKSSLTIKELRSRIEVLEEITTKAE